MRLCQAVSLAVLLLYVCLAKSSTGRVPLSPYPVCPWGLNSSSTVFLVNQSTLSVSDSFTASTLQGLVSRTSSPSIFRLDGDSDYDLWLAMTAHLFQSSMTVNSTFASNLSALISTFHHIIEGYVLCNLDASVSVALTVCANRAYIAFTEDNVHVAQSLQIPLAYDVCNQTIEWAISNFNATQKGSSFSRLITVLQDPSKFLYLGDFSIFAGAVNWWSDDMHSALTKQILQSLRPISAVFGWGPDEFSFVDAASSVEAFVHASDWAINLDFLSNFHFPVTHSLPFSMARTTPKDLSVNLMQSVHTVCFLMTDGDNLQWLLGGFAGHPEFWASPDRGKVNLGWTLSPALVELAPIVMKYLYETASDSPDAMDGFVAAPSGVGYTYPDRLLTTEEVSRYAEFTSQYLNETGMRIVNIIGENYSPDVAASFLARPEIDALLWYDYSDYAALQGNISFVEGKPVIGGRYQLWSGVFYDVPGLIKQLLGATKNPHSPQGYSLVPVHVWSNNVTDVVTVAEALKAAGGFQIATPSEFVQLIQQNLGS